jgi:hypothetical protein
MEPRYLGCYEILKIMKVCRSSSGCGIADEKRWRATAVHDAKRLLVTCELRVSVLECASPLALSVRKQVSVK